MHNIAIYHGSANPLLATKVAKHLNIFPSQLKISKFSDGEIKVQILHNAYNKHIFIIQPTNYPASDNLLELCFIIDAISQQQPLSITAVIPYFGYSRQISNSSPYFNNKYHHFIANSPQIVANILESTSLSAIVCFDLHSPTIAKMFKIPVINLSTEKLFLTDIKKRQLDNIKIIAIDNGAISRSRNVAAKLTNSPRTQTRLKKLVAIHKKRDTAGKINFGHVIGEVKGKICIIIDDIIDTADSIVNAAKLLKMLGAKEILAYCSHPVLSNSNKTLSRLNNSAVTELIVTDSILLSKFTRKYTKVRQISISKLIAEYIRSI